MKRAELQNNLAMTMILVSGAMLFTTLLMGYAIYRTSASMWPPVGFAKVSLGWPILSTVTILLSSWFCHRIKTGINIGQHARASMDLNMTIALGLVFMLIQALFWAQLKDTGLYVSSGIFASILYAFTWIHAAHVIGGIASLVWLRIVFRPSDLRLVQRTINVEKFWHFLGIVWIVLFLTLFVL